MQDQVPIDFRLKLSNQYATAELQCNGTGLQCKDCRSLAWCKEDEKGNLISEPAGICSLTEMCENGRCIVQTDPKCSSIEGFDFPCTTIGMFPDPGDCRKFHICIPKDDKDPSKLIDSTVKCKNDGDAVYGYNPNTTFCDKKLKNNVCSSYPIPFCKHLGETLPLTQNPRLFYTCARHPTDPNLLYPYQQSCPNGKLYYRNHDECL